MRFRNLLNLVGAVIGASGVAMFSAAAVSLLYREWQVAGEIALAGAVTVAVGAVVWRAFGTPTELSTREGFAAVGLAWSLMCLFGALPYLLTGSLPDVADAIFESAAGFTTTGSSVIGEPGALSHGILFWRSLTQWVGGMGIIVLSVAILPLLGMGAVQLVRAESPGPTPDRLTPRFADTAKRLWVVYVGLTVLETVLLWIGDMTLFEAINHSFTTMSTGGFSTNAGSLGAYSAYAQWVVIAFMVLAGTSFALHYKALTVGLRSYLKSVELRVYLTLLGLAAAAMLFGTWGQGAHDTIRDAIFTSATLITTTGYGTHDFALWGPALQIMVVGLMFLGGMAGSTSGGMKTYRLDVLTQASRMDVRRLIQPRGIFVTRVGKDPVPDSIVEAVQTFFLLYMFAFMTGTFGFAIVTRLAGTELGIVEMVSAVATALGNVGPALDTLGPTETFASVPAVGKLMLSGLMVIGRLEILPILILFSPHLWKR